MYVMCRSSLHGWIYKYALYPQGLSRMHEYMVFECKALRRIDTLVLAWYMPVSTLPSCCVHVHYFYKCILGSTGQVV